MTLDDLHRHLKTASKALTPEYTRLFHGRGNTYGAYRFLSVDSVDKVLFAVMFDTNAEEDAIVSMLHTFYTKEKRWEALIVQQRYLPATPSSVIAGTLPYNILKSWSRIRKSGPYDLIIIDPPSFQKGSFAATSDYEKIIRRLHEFAAEECIILSALNAPELNSDFIKTLFRENAPEFEYVERLENLESFPEIEEERSLKNLIFRRHL